MAIYMNFNSLNPAGDVTSQGYENWIKLDNVNFGVGRAITMEPGAMSNREATLPSISEITITKPLDASSSGLFKASVTGDAGVVVEIHIVSTRSDQPEKFATYKMEDVLISSYSVSAAESSAPYESISLSFAKIEADLTHADKTNKNTKNMKVGYDLTLAKPL